MKNSLLFSWKTWILGFLPLLCAAALYTVRNDPAVNLVATERVLRTEQRAKRPLPLLRSLLNVRMERSEAELLRRVARDDAYAVSMLLGAGIDPNAATPAGGSALGAAIQSGSERAALVLLQYGADPEGRTGEHPLLGAVRGDLFAAAIALIHEGAKLDRPGSDGTTPLIAAVMAGRGRFVDLLLREGAPVEQSDSSGRTALMYAHEQPDRSLAERLLQPPTKRAAPETTKEEGTPR